MRVNVDKVLERDQKLSELDDRADALQAGASQFETSAAKLKRKYWWKNCKVPTQLARPVSPPVNENRNFRLAAPEFVLFIQIHSHNSYDSELKLNTLNRTTPF